MSSFEPPRTPILPAHLEQTVQSIAKIHAEHTKSATGLERIVARVTGVIAQSRFVYALSLVTSSWIILNIVMISIGYKPIDPPPFNWLQGAVSLFALYVTVLILTVQRRDDRLASSREQLTLELSIVAEQKIAKVIQLLEEMRRDDPFLRNRHDPEASEMSNTADPEAVLDALTQTHDDLVSDELNKTIENDDRKGNIATNINPL